jgi:DNA topoisomerase-1
MRYKLKNLQHNGIYVAPYEPRGFVIKIQGQTVKLSPKTEQMAIALVKKEQSASPPDRVFYRNFFENFLTQLKAENPSSPFLASFYAEYMKKLEANDPSVDSDKPSMAHAEIDFSEISKTLEQERTTKLNMTKEEKKRLANERKVRREALREKFGYAIVDGKKIEIANWIAEPSCLFSGRGDCEPSLSWEAGQVKLHMQKSVGGFLSDRLPAFERDLLDEQLDYFRV